MNSENRIEVIADQDSNNLTLSFIGKITPLDMPYYLEDLAKALTQLNSGFSVLTDLTDLSFMDIKCAPFIKKIMELFRSRGIKLAVRIIPDESKDIGLNIMSLFHYPHGLKIVTVQSRQEAARVLREEKEG